MGNAFRAKVIDANTEHFIFEITGAVAKIEQFIAILRPLGLTETCCTGIAVMKRAPWWMWRVSSSPSVHSFWSTAGQ